MNNNLSYNNLNKKLFEQLFRDHYTNLCNFAQSYVRDLDTAQEVVQEVFINLWKTRESITSDQSVKSYLYTSVKNRSLNWLRDNKKFRSSLLDIEIEDIEYPFEKDDISESEIQTRIDKALQKLPEKCRQVFEMSRFEDMKYKDIAVKLGISIKTVEVQVSKALKILRVELKDLLTILIMILKIITYK